MILFLLLPYADNLNQSSEPGLILLANTSHLKLLDPFEFLKANEKQYKKCLGTKEDADIHTFPNECQQ